MNEIIKDIYWAKTQPWFDEKHYSWLFIKRDGLATSLNKMFDIMEIKKII